MLYVLAVVKVRIGKSERTNAMSNASTLWELDMATNIADVLGAVWDHFDLLE
jgi:hypothetical protein